MWQQKYIPSLNQNRGFPLKMDQWETYSDYNDTTAINLWMYSRSKVVFCSCTELQSHLLALLCNIPEEPRTSLSYQHTALNHFFYLYNLRQHSHGKFHFKECEFYLLSGWLLFIVCLQFSQNSQQVRVYENLRNLHDYLLRCIVTYPWYMIKEVIKGITVISMCTFIGKS